MTPYPFHFASIAPLNVGNYYGCDPYNTADAPRLRQRVRVAPTVRPIDPWAALGQLLAGGSRNG